MNASLPRILAIVPARGGSKGLPRKNVLPLNGRPLITYSIQAAIDCPLVTTTIVSTEDTEIAAIAAAAGVRVIERPIELASDRASSEDVISHAVSLLGSAGENFDYIALLQPTSPLRSSAHLTECIQRFLTGSFRSAISVTECPHHPMKSLRLGSDGTLEPFFDVRSLSAPRQLLPKAYAQNGAIYIAESSGFRQFRSLFLEPVMPFEMNSNVSIDIDSREDMDACERILACVPTS